MSSLIPDAKILHNCLTEPLNGSNLRTLFLLLTRTHYSDPKNYGPLETQLSCVKYSEDPKERSLYVDLAQEYDYSKGLRRPAVYVGFPQPTVFKKLDMQHKMENFTDNSGFTSGVLATVGMEISHVANSIDTAFLLADSTTSFYFAIRDTIKDHLKLLAFDPISISDAKLIEKAPERFFKVDATFSLTFTYQVNTNIESHRLKKLAIEAAAI